MGVQISMKPVEEMLWQRGIERGGRVQKYIDSAVVRFCDKYVPMRTGTLKKARGTVYGSGYVRYNEAYAKQQYYKNTGRGNEGTVRGGLRGRRWFDRMKAAHRDDILRGAAQLAEASRRRR